MTNPMEAVVMRYINGKPTLEDIEVLAGAYVIYWLMNKKKEQRDLSIMGSPSSSRTPITDKGSEETDNR